MILIYRARGPYEIQFDNDLCAASVPWKGIRRAGFHQCRRRWTVRRVVDGKEYGFCKQHDPVKVKERERQKEEAYWVDIDRQRQEGERRRLEREYCKELTNDELMARLDKYDALKQAIERLLEYVAHKPECNLSAADTVGTNWTPECTCGLDALLAEVGE